MTGRRLILSGLAAATAAVLAFGTGTALARHEPGRRSPATGRHICPPANDKGDALAEGRLCPPPPVVDYWPGMVFPAVRAGQGPMD
ncbi:hypothetical protein [Actinomadura gamaensis]|uniref:Secreted protein n=1 Tax=Actinomadura gamaensis TaxID=1763541 RepID=A0ABV9U3P2_9ACTN